MTLLELRAKVQAKIAKINTDARQRSRLNALGICEGALIEKTQESSSGRPVFIFTEQRCTLAIGYDLASKILITTE